MYICMVGYLLRIYFGTYEGAVRKATMRVQAREETPIRKSAEAIPKRTLVEVNLDELNEREDEFRRRGSGWAVICLVMCDRAQRQTEISPVQYEHAVVVALYLHDDIDASTYDQLTGHDTIKVPRCDEE